MELSNSKAIFFEALNYPEYARPNFYIKKQVESGWEKGVFLTSLNEVYYAYENYFSILYSAKKRQIPGLTIDQITIPLNDLINGNKKVLTKELLDQLYLAVTTAYEIGRPEKTYTKEEVLSFVEYSLNFIREEFKIQSGEIENLNFRPRTQTYFFYQVVQDAPFFDFPKFKQAVRELLTSSKSALPLKHILQKYYDAAIEIINLWNNKISLIEENSSNNSTLPEIGRVEFKSHTLNHSWWNDVSLFTIKNPQLYTNQNFAIYASNIAKLLANEVLNSPEVCLAGEKDFITDFIIGIQQLQSNGCNEQCIKNIIDGKLLEAPFRYAFATWFRAKGYSVEIEPEIGPGRIDLKIMENDVVKRIVEFKGWWNNDKQTIVQQVCSYLTDFEIDGYIFMVNHTKTKSITNLYKEFVTTPNTGYLIDSWKEIKFENTAFQYYKSKHKIGTKTKDIYHFIVSAHPVPFRKTT